MASLNSRDYFDFSVECVESVENSCKQPVINGLCKNEPSTNFPKNHVEVVGIINLTDYFSRLSTILKDKSVDEARSNTVLIPNGLETGPQIPQTPQKKNDKANKFEWFNQNKLALAMDWIQIAIEEGHIEPSQPSVGRLVGWPIRSFSVESLYVDLIVWCRQKDIREWDVPERSLFFALLDEILTRSGNRYEFPMLSTCRERLMRLKEML